MGYRPGLRRKVLIAALFVGAIVAGSTLPDLDHLAPGYRSWGHNYWVPLVILICLVIAYCGRQLRARFLKRKEKERRYNNAHSR